MRRWLLALAVAGALGGSTGSAGTLEDGGRIVLRGEGSGIVHYVAEGPGIPGRYEADCPEACSVTWQLQGVTITLTATPVEDSRFGGWGGVCASAGRNPTCTFTGVAGMNVVEARFDPPKDTRVVVPMRGTTTLTFAPSFVGKLRRQGWKLQAIRPATLRGRTLTLPIAPSGPLTRSSRRTSSLLVGRLEGRCWGEHEPIYAVHHAGGLRLSRPSGRLSVLPLDKPVLLSVWGISGIAFRDARRREPAFGILVKTVETRFASDSGVVKAGMLRLGGLGTKMWESAWDGLVENSAKPAITSGPFATVELRLRIPPKACS